MSGCVRRDRLHKLLLATTSIGWVGLAASALAQASDQAPPVGPATLTPDRLVATAGAVAALIGAVIGGLAFSRSRRGIGPGKGRRGAVVALVMGPIGLVVGVLIVVTADGGLGTGNGIAGGYLAIVVGLIGMALGGLAVARSGRVA
jgi:hypothetical protein